MAIYSLDGVDLDDARMRWVLAEGTTLSTRGEPWRISVDIPGRFGSLPIAPTVLKSATVALKFQVFSWDDGRNGNRCKGGLARLEQNYQELLRRLYAFGRLQTLAYTPEGRPVREALVRPSSSVEPVLDPEAEQITFTITYEIVDGLWRGKDIIVDHLSSMAKFNGCVMPIPDGWLMLEPTASTCTVRDNVSGTSFTFTGTLTGGERLLVDVAGYRAWKNASQEWQVQPNARSADGEISMSPGGFRATPDADGRISMTLTGCTGRFRGRMAY
uniref:Phage tail protein n=1 Tax=Dulem virus 38 TaxID=3145756 RepID=A0AAU8B239_9CAUD